MDLKTSLTLLLTSITDTFRFAHDLEISDEAQLLEKIKQNALFSSSYLLLLGSSAVVCTLGLLLSNSPVVIGGMIMSPLMWPLMKIAVGFSFNKPLFVVKAMFLLLLSIALSIFVSYSITIISPVKVLNQEITARTTPTLLDLIVAIIAGGIAAIGIANKKVSDTLAGVAIATSLLPPLCVGGIGVAIANQDIAFGGLLLFFSNVVSIIFAAVLVFVLLGLHQQTLSKFGKSGLVALALVLIVTAIPLFSLLQGYSFRSTVHQQVTKILLEEFVKISPNIYMDDVKTSVQQSGAVGIQVRVLMPKDLGLDYQQKQSLIARLELALHKKIELELFVQELLTLKSEKEIQNGELQRQITQLITDQISGYGSSVSIDTLNIQEDGLATVFVELYLRG